MKLLITAGKNFVRDQATDLAAGLTYYAVMAIFPAVLALVSLLAVVGESGSVLSTVNDVLNPLLSDKALSDLQPTLVKLTTASGAPVTLAVGAAAALFSASGYVGAFSRAMNIVRDVEETRPFWKLRPLMFLITLAAVVLNAVALVIIVGTGPVAKSVGRQIGLGNRVLDIWDIAKWPVLALVVVVVVALLYHATPNIKYGRIRLLTPGAFLALLLWAAASTGFAFYVANFGSYNKTYGSIAGVIIGLLWLYLTNIALLFGAELDAAREAEPKPPPVVEPSPVVEPVETTQPAPPPAPLTPATVAVPAPPPAAVPDPASAVGPGETAEPATSSGWRRDKVVLKESFPRKAGQPHYGPQPQPIPHED